MFIGMSVSKKKKILVVDDSATVRNLLKKIFIMKGYQVDVVTDGLEAIQYVYHNPPDLVLLDLEMPRINGFQTCRFLKEEEITKDIPVIILTSRLQKGARFWGRSVGADAYVTKDVEDLALEEEVEKQFQLYDRDNRIDLQKSPGHELSEQEIMERVIYMLDRKLFQSSIINEVNLIGLKSHNQEEFVFSLLRLVRRICDYYLAGIMIKREEGDRLYIFHSKPASKALHKWFVNYSQDQFKPVDGSNRDLNTPQNLKIRLLREKKVGPISQRAKNISQQPENYFYQRPINIGNNNENVGFLSLVYIDELGLTKWVKATLELFFYWASLNLKKYL